MIQPPRRPKRFAEPEITSAMSVWRSLMAASVMAASVGAVEKRRAYRTFDPRLELLGIIVLAPVFAAITVAILLPRGRRTRPGARRDQPERDQPELAPATR